MKRGTGVRGAGVAASRSSRWHKLTALLLAMFLVATPTMAYAAQSNSDIDQNVATRATLDTVVASQVDSVYGSIKSNISDYASQIVIGLIGNRDSIKAFVKPLLTDSIKSELGKVNISSERVDALVDTSVDKVINNQYIDKILDHEFTQAVIARTVKYAADDIISQLNIDADRDKVVADISDHIWNASLKKVGTATTLVKSDLSIVAAAGGVANTSYYNFSVVSWNSVFGIKTTPKEINVTGWNTSNINTYIAGSVGLSTGSKYNEYASALGKLNYSTILWNATKNAFKDEIVYRLDKLYRDAKAQVVTCVQNKLAEVGVTVTLNPTDNFEKIATDIEAAVKQRALADTKLTVETIWLYLLS